MPLPRESLRTALALAVVAAGALVLLLGTPAADLDGHLWGPEQPWAHWDLLCGWWLFQAAGGAFGETGAAGIEAGAALLRHPGGEAPWPTQFPNPWDALALGPLVVDAPFPRWWNLTQLGQHLANLLAATWLCRAAGARARSAAAAGLILAATPVMLHEVAGGRIITGVVWPALLAWGLLLWTRRAPLRPSLAGGGTERSGAEGGFTAGLPALAAGLLVGLQGLAYLYTGLLAGLVGLLLCRDRRQVAGLAVGAALPVGAYLLWLLPTWHGGHAAPPPAGFTQLPLAGLLGLDLVADRFRLHPALLLGLLGLGLSRRRGRLLLALGLLLLVAAGPAPTWVMGDSQLGPSPLALLLDAIPPLGRMHHPVRATLLLAPFLALGLARLLDRWPGPAPLLAALLALPMVHATRVAVGWPTVGPPPGLAAAAWLARQPGDGAVVDLTGHRGAALALHPVHGRALLSGFGPDQDGLRGEIAPWRAGAPVPTDILAALGDDGFAWVLVVDRGDPVAPDGLRSQLGAPVFDADGAAVYALP